MESHISPKSTAALKDVAQNKPNLTLVVGKGAHPAILEQGKLLRSTMPPKLAFDEFRPQIEAFSRAIRGGPIPPSGGAEGYIDMAIISALYRSAEAGVPQAVELGF